MEHLTTAWEIFENSAELYESKYMDVSPYALDLDKFLELLPAPAAHILEIACGPGNLTHYLLTKQPALQVLATDFSSRMIALAKKNCPGVEFRVLDCRNINSLQPHYDGIIIGFCLPYLTMQEASKLVKDVAKLLAENGSIYLSTIEKDHGNSGVITAGTGDKVMVHYYALTDIEQMFSEAGLSLLSHRRVTVPQNPYKDVELIVVGQKKKS